MPATLGCGIATLTELQLGASTMYFGLKLHTENLIIPEFGISDSRFSCYVGFPTDAYYIYPPNNMDGKMQNCKVQMKFTL